MERGLYERSISFQLVYAIGMRIVRIKRMTQIFFEENIKAGLVSGFFVSLTFFSDHEGQNKRQDSYKCGNDDRYIGYKFHCLDLCKTSLTVAKQITLNFNVIFFAKYLHYKVFCIYFANNNYLTLIAS